MNPTMMLMLSRALEAERRRAIARRPRRFSEPEVTDRPGRRIERTPRWFRLPKAAGTTA